MPIIPVLGKKRLEVPDTHWPVCLAKSSRSRFSERPCQKIKWKVIEEVMTSTSSLHIHAFMNTQHTHAHTQARTHTHGNAAFPICYNACTPKSFTSKTKSSLQ